MKQPLVAPLAALAAGIWAARFAEFTLGETLLSVGLLVVLALVAVRLRAGFAGAAACLAGFFLSGALLGSLPRPGDPSNDPLLITRVLDRENVDLGDPIRLRGWVREPPEDLGDVDRFVLEAESIFRHTPVRGGIRVTLHRFPGARPLRLDYGRRVEFLARLRRLHNFQNPGSFDYVGYMNRQGIFASASVRPGVPILALEGCGGGRFESVVWTARLWARARFSALAAAWAASPRPTSAALPPIPPAEAPEPPVEGSEMSVVDARPNAPGILQAMLLGERDGLDRQTITDFQRTGAYHVLVISGLHVGLLAFVLLRFLRLLWVPRGIASTVTILLAAAYALLVGAGTPVLRSAWMLAAYLVTILVYRQRRALNVIAGTALLFLVADPRLLSDAGFQLSFVAVALIAGIAVPLLRTTLEPRRLALRDIWNTDRDLYGRPEVVSHRVAIRTWLEPLVMLTRLPRSWVSIPLIATLWVLLWAGELAIVSFVVQAGLAAPLAVHFQRVSWSAVSANLVIVPLLSLAVPTGLVALLSGWAPAAAISIWAAEGIGRTVQWHAQHVRLEMRVPPPPFWLSALFGLSLVLLALSFDSTRRRQLVTAAASVTLLVALVLHPFPPKLAPGRLEMSLLDVGQGESIFVALPGGQTIVVDGGGQPDFRDPTDPPSRRQPIDIGEAVVSPYLWSRSLKKLDVVAVTHADQDHVGGIPALLRNFAVAELWLGERTFGPEYRGLEQQAKARGTSVRYIHEGQSYAFGEVQIEVLGPSEPPAKRRNDESVVLCLHFGEQRFLLTGDIERDREDRLVASGVLRPSGILKVAHHGSRSSTEATFLRTVQPVFAVISAGADNFYGHPHEAVLKRLARARATVLRTDQEGLISITSDGHRLAIDTFRRRHLDGGPASEPALVAGR
jgi:competence protein ComEC